jgi:signal peptide peptidase SppA
MQRKPQAIPAQRVTPKHCLNRLNSGTSHMIDLPHVASRVFGTPLMIARAKLEVILGVLAPRLAGSTSEPIDPEADPAPQTSITVERIAVVSVIGTLVSRSGYLAAASGLVSYADIGDAIAAAMDDPSVRGVILDIDSPGGEVGGLFDLVEQIGAIKAGNSKLLWAVANESALSAAYAVASATDRLYVTRTGEVGSIGVVAVHVDESGADAKAGLAWTFVFAGERKIDANGHEPLSERARVTIQADVDRLYTELCGLVASNRGLTNEAVRATDAAIYRGELAIRAGLADRLGTLDLAIAEMVTELDRTASTARNIVNPTPKRSPSMATTETERIQHDATEPQPPLASQAVPQALNPEPTLPAPEPAADPAPVPGPADQLRAEFAEIAALAAQAARLGVMVDAADAMRKGISADALRRSVLEALAARAEATSVIAAAPSTPISGDSPIVRRAKERAAAARA